MMLFLASRFGRDSRDGGRPARLRGAQVRAQDFRIGVLVADINGPDTCSCADVEDSAGLWPDRGEE